MEKQQGAADRMEEKDGGERGDQEIRKWSDTLLHAALAKCGSLEDARDLVQDTLLAFLPAGQEGKPSKIRRLFYIPSLAGSTMICCERSIRFLLYPLRPMIPGMLLRMRRIL